MNTAYDNWTFLLYVDSLIYQGVNVWKIAFQNADDWVFAYFSPSKNDLRLSFCSSFNVKKFNAVYELTDIFDMELDRVILSVPVIWSKNDERYVLGCKRLVSNIAPLYVKSPINCYSNGVSRYNKNSTWKIGLDISCDKEWMEK